MLEVPEGGRRAERPGRGRQRPERDHEHAAAGDDPPAHMAPPRPGPPRGRARPPRRAPARRAARRGRPTATAPRSAMRSEAPTCRLVEATAAATPACAGGMPETAVFVIGGFT